MEALRSLSLMSLCQCDVIMMLFVFGFFFKISKMLELARYSQQANIFRVSRLEGKSTENPPSFTISLVEHCKL